MLMRSFTRREKIMLVILALVLVVGLYFLLVHRPVEAKLEELAKEQEDLELMTDVAQAMLIQRNSMQAELDEIFALPKDQITVMPEYDNAETLIMQLNNIFMGLEPRLSFPAVRINEGIATRPIDFEFEAPSYEEARAILTRLTRTGYRSLLDGLSIRPSETRTTTVRGRTVTQRVENGNIQEGSVVVKGTIYFYELVPESQREAS